MNVNDEKDHSTYQIFFHYFFPFQIFFIYPMCKNIFIPTCPSLNPWCVGGVYPSCRSWSRGRAASSASPAACPASADSLSGLKNIYQVSENYLKLFLLIIIFYFEEMLRSRQPRLSHKVLSWGLSEFALLHFDCGHEFLIHDQKRKTSSLLHSTTAACSLTHSTFLAVKSNIQQ